MKRIISLGLLLIAMLLPSLAAAAETTLITTVPARHTLTIDCGPHGAVLVNGQVMRGRFTISVARFGSVTLTALPDSGYRFSGTDGVGQDVLTIQGNTISLRGICSDMTLSVSFAKLPPDPYRYLVEDPLTEPELWLGEGELLIVYDHEDTAQSYHLLPLVNDDRSHTLCVIADQPASGDPACRRLMLTAVQLRRLQRLNVTTLLFINGDACLVLSVGDMLQACAALSKEYRVLMRTIRTDHHLPPPQEDDVLPPARLWAGSARYDAEPWLSPAWDALLLAAPDDAQADEVITLPPRGMLQAEITPCCHVLVRGGRLMHVLTDEHTLLDSLRRDYTPRTPIKP